jgi:hypothetical protein
VRQHSSRVEHEQLEQLVLGARQLDELLAHPHPVAVGVDPQLTEPEAAIGRRLPAGAAEQRAQPRLELVHVERLDQVVVGPGIQSVDPVRHGVASGQHQHRDPVALAPKQPAHLEPVDVGQPDVEDDRVGHGAAHRGECVGAGLGQPHLVTGQREGAAQDVAQTPIVVDH